jgi:transcriptional regulator with XRE-family HTH domain
MNKALIKKRLKEMKLTQKDIADKEIWNCAKPTVSQKLSGARPMSLEEANALAKLLNLSDLEYFVYFFTHESA